MADKTFGINHSRLASLRLNRRGLSIGRVQTATLGLVVTRDEAINNHINEKYYELELNTAVTNQERNYSSVNFKFKPNTDVLSDGKHITDIEVLERVKSSLDGSYSAICGIKETKTYAP